MRVRYTLPAIVDLDAVLSSITRHSPHGANRVRASIKAAETLLEQLPLARRRTRLPWLRRFKVAAYPYLILYEVTDTEVIIHTVRQAARRPIA